MRLRRLLLAGLVVAGALAAAATVAPGGGKAAAAAPGCTLGRKGNKIQHVIYIVFRQPALPAGQPERAVRPRADAPPAQLHHRQRHAADEPSHDPDLAHCGRDPVQHDRALSRPERDDRLEQLRLLQGERLPAVHVQVSNSGTCGGSTRFCVDPKFAWNHGDFQDEIANNWLGLVGPGVRHDGIDSTTWSDHTDVRPTMLSVLGLADGYVDDGRVLMQSLSDDAISKQLNEHEKTNQQLADVDKQLNAPFGEFGLATLATSTKALASTDPLVYDSLEARIASLTLKRDALAGEIRDALTERRSGDRS
jgi:hypothetical protein